MHSDCFFPDSHISKTERRRAGWRAVFPFLQPHLHRSGDVQPVRPDITVQGQHLYSRPGGPAEGGAPCVQPAGAGQEVPAWVAAQQQVSPEMEEATNNYVTELKNLTDMLTKVAEQSARLTRDSEEMENLNRTLTGICKVYEMQLKGASAQIGTIDAINEQSRKMASQIEQLNKIYARMIEAMTVNMRATATGGNNSEA